MHLPSAASIEACGLDSAATAVLLLQLESIVAIDDARARWQYLCREVVTPAQPFALHQLLYRANYENELAAGAIAPQWLPDPVRQTNVARWAAELGCQDYRELYQWSIAEREAFNQRLLADLQLQFETPPQRIFSDLSDPRHCSYLPGARMNIVASCFQADAEATAIVHDAGGRLQRVSYGELRALTARVANGLWALGLEAGERVAISMPMDVNAVAQYLGIIAAGCTAVCVADSFSASELALRLRLTDARYLFIQDVLKRSGRQLDSYAKLASDDPCRAIVLAADGAAPCLPLRDGDLQWQAFLSDDVELRPVVRGAQEEHTLLFSSGTTSEPKVIPWDHSTPIKAAGDALLQHDVHSDDTLCWPTNLGWMMGPWLVFAALLNKSSMALSQQAPNTSAFCQFVDDAGVTMLGLVPSLVRAWRQQDCVADCDWTGIQRFSSTGECSNAEDMHWLMMQAGCKPVIEYCGGTEVGGGYITGCMDRPAQAGTFSCKALGFEWLLLDEEVFFVPPVLGLSTRLLNKDHDAVYFADCPPGPDGQVLRRHGDQIDELGDGYYRALGRSDDTMNLGGIKVSAVQIERLLSRLDAVHEVAAIAVAPEGGGPSQLVIYAVLLEDGDRTELQAAMQHCIRQQLNPLFKIHDLCLIEALPRTASNKVRRRDLRKQYDAQQAAG